MNTMNKIGSSSYKLASLV